MTAIMLVLLVLALPSQLLAVEEPAHRHHSGESCGKGRPDASGSRLEGIQLETSDIASHELLFETVLGAGSVFKIDHPQVDHLRGYCYRGVLIVVRQDLKTPRPTGWVQVNFVVPDAEAIKAELEAATQRALGNRETAARDKIIRLKLKADVPRSNCRATRLELYGPEGFLIGFDQFKPGSCESAKQP